MNQQRASRLAQHADSGLHGFLDNMIVPTSLDAYLKPVGGKQKLAGKGVVDFRKNYTPKQSRNRDRETVSYDALDHVVHPRRLLLSAECQIGKTGAYLALLKDLMTSLPSQLPEVTVVLPDVNSMPPPGPDDDSDVPQGSEAEELVVDYDRSVPLQGSELKQLVHCCPCPPLSRLLYK